MSSAAPGELTASAPYSFPVTAVVFAVISVVLYQCLLKPLFKPAGNNEVAATIPSPRERRARTNNAQQQRAVPARPARLPAARTTRRSATTTSDDDMMTLLAEQTVCPPHMAPASASRYLDTGGISLLKEGLLPFRHGCAAAYEQSLDATILERNRKDRARVLSRILSLSEGHNSSSSSSSSISSPPPSWGSTVVISIPIDSNLHCPQLHRVLYLLSTHFNTMVILGNVPDEMSNPELDRIVEALHDSIDARVLPKHRIVAATSVTGRVAFVRQLGRVEFVLDYDEEMYTQLSRFGFKVIIYDNDDKSLGDTLLS